ncbi:hypothetical protein NFI96_002744 [Prochilodus magdalenae]|nr:hypothetical protein NFI96_002744 [Prochilodus magdalenae]
MTRNSVTYGLCASSGQKPVSSRRQCGSYGKVAVWGSVRVRVRDWEDCTHTDLMQHQIDTGTAAPIWLSPHRLPLAKRQAAEQKLKEMVEAGVIEPANSPWAGPVVLVKKKDGNCRFCVDYRHLNAVTKMDSYPLPCIDDALDGIPGSSWFSSLDLRSGYWQVALAPDAKEKTAFTLGAGLCHSDCAVTQPPLNP